MASMLLVFYSKHMALNALPKLKSRPCLFPAYNRAVNARMMMTK